MLDYVIGAYSLAVGVGSVLYGVGSWAVAELEGTDPHRSIELILLGLVSIVFGLAVLEGS